MKTLLDNLANLIKVKTIVTFAVAYVFVRLSIASVIGTDQIMLIVSMVFAFYFGTQFEKKQQ